MKDRYRAFDIRAFESVPDLKILRMKSGKSATVATIPQSNAAPNFVRIALSYMGITTQFYVLESLECNDNKSSFLSYNFLLKSRLWH